MLALLPARAITLQTSETTLGMLVWYGSICPFPNVSNLILQSTDDAL